MTTKLRRCARSTSTEALRAAAGAASGLAGALWIAALGWACAAAAQEAVAFTAPVAEHRLPNGLLVVVVPWDSPGVVAFATLVRTGSRDEVEPGRSGFAHFFEHMMFRGTPRHPQEEYTRILRDLGADDNAITSDDRTLYTILGPAAALETIMELEADRFQNLAYSEEVFRAEAGAILGEYDTTSSLPEIALLERLRRVAFDRHPYGHTTLGRLADIRAMSTGYEYSRSFFHRYYRPENTVLVVVGDIQAATVFSLAEHYYGAWEPGYEPPAVPTEPAQTAPRRDSLRFPGATAPWLAVGFRAPAFSTDSVDTAAIDVLAALLFGEASALYQDLVVGRRLADVLDGALTDHRDPYLFEILIRATEERHLPEIESALSSALVAMQEQPVDPARLAGVKSHLRYEFALELTSPLSVAEDLCHYLALTGSVETVNELFARYGEVTADDVQRVARALFAEARETVIRLVPGDGAGSGPGEAP